MSADEQVTRQSRSGKAPPRLVAGSAAALTAALAWTALAGGPLWIAQASGVWNEDTQFTGLGAALIVAGGWPVSVVVSVLAAVIPKPGDRPGMSGMRRALAVTVLCLVIGGGLLLFSTF